MHILSLPRVQNVGSMTLHRLLFIAYFRSVLNCIEFYEVDEKGTKLFFGFYAAIFMFFWTLTLKRLEKIIALLFLRYTKKNMLEIFRKGKTELRKE